VQHPFSAALNGGGEAIFDRWSTKRCLQTQCGRAHARIGCAAGRKLV